MKKKVIIAIAVIIAVAAIVFAFGRSKEEKPDDNRVSIGEIIETTTKKNGKEEKTTERVTEKETEKETEIKKKDPDKIVEFEIPLLFVEAEYQNNLKRLAKEKGYESATLSFDKKKVKIKLRSLSYDLYLMKTGISTMSAICETFESKDYPYVKNLGEYEDDFSHVTLLVNSKKYRNADNKDELFTHISNCCAYYLLQDNDSPNKYTIDICDEKTGTKIESRQFNKKDFLRWEEMQNELYRIWKCIQKI